MTINFSTFYRQLKKSKLGLIGLTIVGFYVIIGILAPFVAPAKMDPQIKSFPKSPIKFAKPNILRLLDPNAQGERTFLTDVGTFENTSVIDGDLTAGHFKISVENFETSVNVSYEITDAPPASDTQNRFHSGKALHVIFKDDGVTEFSSVKLTLEARFSWTQEEIPDGLRLLLSALYQQNQIAKDSQMENLFQISAKIYSAESAGFELLAKKANLGVAPYEEDWIQYSYEMDQLEVVKTFKTMGEIAVKIEIEYLPQQNPTAKGTAEFYLDNLYVQLYSPYEGVLGTDSQGQDVFSILLYGALDSVIITLVGVVFAIIFAILGASLTIISNRNRFQDHWGSKIVQWIIDTTLAIGSFGIILLAALIAFAGFLNVLTLLLVIILGAVFTAYLIEEQLNAPTTIKTLKKDILLSKNQSFIEALKETLTRYSIPIIFVTVIVFQILQFGLNIITLGFIESVGYPWGKLLADGISSNGLAEDAWWTVIPPVFALWIYNIGLAFLGYGITRAIKTTQTSSA